MGGSEIEHLTVASQTRGRARRALAQMFRITTSVAQLFQFAYVSALE